MGVDRTDYIVYGWKLPYKIEGKNGPIDMWSDKFLPMIEGHPGEKYFICNDGMCAKYNVFGVLVDTSDDYEGWLFQELTIPKVDVTDLKNRYTDIFESEPQVEPTLFIFSHYG